MDERLQKVEQLIENNELEEAQKLLDSVKEKSGEKYFLQGKLFVAKKWYTEARKQYKKAVKEEPDNERYKDALDELEAFCKTDEYKQMKNVQMGKDGFAEACCMCGGECCGTLLCEAICNGCS